jgi:hypothetical protein|tara:strand:- start:3114 stop:3602 length:489 start_codon:yes stop_codon:yes gene_type:complete
MIQDALAYFSPPTWAAGVGYTYDGDDVTTNADASTEFTDDVDLGARLDTFGASDSPDGGETGRLWFNAVVVTSLTGTAGGILAINLYDDSSALFDSPEALLVSAGSFVRGTNSDAGAFLSVPLPGGVINRYLRAKAEATVQNITDGDVVCWIGPGPVQNPAR